MKRLFVFLTSLFLGTFPSVYSQITQQPLSEEAIKYLSSKTCDCITKNSNAADKAEMLKECATGAIVANADYIKLQGVDEKSIDYATGREIGLAMFKVLMVDCAAYMAAAQQTKSAVARSKADSLYEQGKYEAALVNYNMTFSAFQKLFDKYFFNGRGLTKLALGDYFGALADFEFAVQIDTTFANGYSNRGLAKLKLKADQDALDDYNKALSLDSSNATMFSNRGYLYQQNEMWDEAELDFLRANQLDGNSATTNFYLGKIKYSKRELTEDNLSYFNKAIQLDSVNADYHNYRGLFRWDLGNKIAAAEDFKRAIELDKANNAAYYNLAQLSFLEKDYVRGLGYINEALKIDTTYDLYYRQRADILMGQKKWADAERDLAKSMELNPKNAEQFDMRATVFENTNQPQKAIADLSKSIELYPSDGKVYFRRAMLKLKLGNKVGACEDLVKSKELKDEQGTAQWAKVCKKK
jgi:tetratricopeptide (TPR) repeat protein